MTRIWDGINIELWRLHVRLQLGKIFLFYMEKGKKRYLQCVSVKVQTDDTPSLQPSLAISHVQHVFHWIEKLTALNVWKGISPTLWKGNKPNSYPQPTLKAKRCTWKRIGMNSGVSMCTSYIKGCGTFLVGRN